MVTLTSGRDQLHSYDNDLRSNLIWRVEHAVRNQIKATRYTLHRTVAPQRKRQTNGRQGIATDTRSLGELAVRPLDAHAALATLLSKSAFAVVAGASRDSRREYGWP